MNEMRRLINLVESAQHEQLDEGPVGKALATAALALGLNFGQQVQADQVYVYQDAQGELKATKNVMQIPDNTELSYVVDTDTEQIKYLKKPEQSQQQPEFTGDVKVAVDKIKSALYDDSSAKFKDIIEVTLENGDKLVFGQYTAKNRMGGYSGWREFAYTSTGIEQPFGFAKSWIYKGMTQPGGIKVDDEQSGHAGYLRLGVTKPLEQIRSDLHPFFGNKFQSKVTMAKNIKQIVK